MRSREALRPVRPPRADEIWEWRTWQQALEQREELSLLLEDLIETLADGVVALDFRGRVVHVSDSLRGTGRDDDAPPLPHGVLQRLRRESRKTRPGQARRFDLPWDRPEIGTRIYTVVAAAGRGGEEPEERVLTLFAFHDRTRETSLQEELSRSRGLAALGQMAATVAHELRNPLGAIQGFATLLERDLAGQPEPLRQLERILRGVESANRIVADLLEYCRPLRPVRESISLPALLEQSVALLRSSDRLPGSVRVELKVDPGLPACWGDPRLLLQALGNLLQNALEAISGSGTVTVHARPGGPSPRADRLRIVIRDSGCGLTADEVAQVFAPFYTTKPGGTGLGLALVRRIIEAHQGHVHVVSAPGQGTSVVLDLPAAGKERGLEDGGTGIRPEASSSGSEVSRSDSRSPFVLHEAA